MLISWKTIEEFTLAVAPPFGVAPPLSARGTTTITMAKKTF
jgi:hypothetical protein